MKSSRFVLSLFILLVLSSGTFSQTKTINIWKGKIPGAIDNPAVKEYTFDIRPGAPRIRDVTNPKIKVFFPKNKGNGTAVLICPGGGYTWLAMPVEGYDVAEWLNGLGVTAIVLKYRLPSDSIMENKSVGPLEDAQEAMRDIRRHAKEWNINPDRIGVMGFSAGGHLASTLCTHYNDKIYDSDTISARPDFAVLAYPVISMRNGITHEGSRKRLLGENPDSSLVRKFSNELHVTDDTPPAFIVQAEDDKSVPVLNSILYFEALKKHNIPAELHIYQKGGHGFGLAKDRGNDTESNWPKACESWLRMRGLIK